MTNPPLVRVAEVDRAERPRRTPAASPELAVFSIVKSLLQLKLEHYAVLVVHRLSGNRKAFAIVP
jgi:uncharacterized protein (DUF2141 family)